MVMVRIRALASVNSLLRPPVDLSPDPTGPLPPIETITRIDSTLDPPEGEGNERGEGRGGKCSHLAPRSRSFFIALSLLIAGARSSPGPFACILFRRKNGGLYSQIIGLERYQYWDTEKSDVTSI